MSDDKTFTERDVILRERKAYIEGARATEAAHRSVLRCSYFHDLSIVESQAQRIYALPKVKRPRVVERIGAFGPLCMKINGVEVMFTYASKAAAQSANIVWNPLRYHLERGNESLADDILFVAEMLLELSAQPTETVDAD